MKTQKGNKNALSLYEEMGDKVVGTDKVFYKRMI